MNPLQARKIVLDCLSAMSKAGLSLTRKSVLAYIESRYKLTREERQAIVEQILELCQD
jgi:hypothetical protein